MTQAKRKATLADVKSASSPAERTVVLCVDGKLLAEHAEAVAVLDAARQASSGSLESAGVREAAEAVAAIEQQMAEHTFSFRMRALRPKAWSDLLAAHPARPGKNEGFNAETFVPAAVAACCLEPEGIDTPDDALELFESLANVEQRAELFSAAFEVNTAAVDIPKSGLASVVLRSFEPSSTTAPAEASPAPSS